MGILSILTALKWLTGSSIIGSLIAIIVIVIKVQAIESIWHIIKKLIMIIIIAGIGLAMTLLITGGYKKYKAPEQISTYTRGVSNLTAEQKDLQHKMHEADKDSKHYTNLAKQYVTNQKTIDTMQNDLNQLKNLVNPKSSS